MVGREVFEVLYSPVKAFRKIIEKPDLKGVLLVLLLVIASTVVFQFVYNSKQLYENRAPENDEWTESLMDSHIWVSNGSLILDDSDYKMGNSSVTSSVPNATSIWLKITDFDSINCSEEKGYTEFFFWINWTNEAETFPSSGTLKLFSGSEDSYFESDITDLSSSGEWTNITLNVGPDQGWASTNSADWQNITGIEFNLVWSDSENLTINVDGLFFRNFVSPIEALGFSGAMLFLFVSVALMFLIIGVLPFIGYNKLAALKEGELETRRAISAIEKRIVAKGPLDGTSSAGKFVLYPRGEPKGYETGKRVCALSATYPWASTKESLREYLGKKVFLSIAGFETMVDFTIVDFFSPKDQNRIIQIPMRSVESLVGVRNADKYIMKGVMDGKVVFPE